MLITRRQLLSLAAATPYVASSWYSREAGAVQNVAVVAQRVSGIIETYDRQGFHRTGTAVDQQSAEWLIAEVRRAGLAPVREPYSCSRIDPNTGLFLADGRRVVGLPLFDGAFTDGAGVQGRLGALGSDAELGVGETAPNQAASRSLGDARRRNQHKAIVCVTRGARSGLCPSNADFFQQPFGPPVLQVSSEEASWLNELASRRREVQIIASVKRTTVTTANVTATIKGADSALPPLVICTPRTGWYNCASERGGGLACWLETMRALRTIAPARTIIFVAFSGHELGYLGIHAFADRRPGILSHASAWIHFGANIGAAIGPGNRLIAPDDDFEKLATRAMAASELRVDALAPRGTVPGGEAEVVHHGGGRCLAVTGQNDLFHNPDDRGAQSVDAGVIARFCSAFTAVATSLVAR